MRFGSKINDGSVQWQVKKDDSSENEGNITYVNNNTDIDSFRNIGELVFSSLKLVDAGLHLLDGALINGNGIYRDFVKYIKSIYSDNSNSFYHDKYVAKDFLTPTLTDYGMIGGDTFACFSNCSYDYGNYRPFRLFDGIKNNNPYSWVAKNGKTSEYIVFYNPKPLKLLNLKFYNIASANYAYATGTVYGSHNGRQWEVIKEFANDNNKASGIWDIDMSTNSKYYKWFKVDGITAGKTLEIRHIDILATYKSDNNNDDIAFTQPILSDDYPPGLDKFGLYVGSRYADSTYPAWRAFDKGTADANRCLYNTNHTLPQFFIFYNPDPIMVKKIRLVACSNRNFKKANLYGFNDTTLEWEFLGEDTNLYVNADNLIITFNYDQNNNYYKTYKLEFTEYHNTSYCGFREMQIIAKHQAVLKTASDQYFEELMQYGCNGKFVYDQAANTVRLPKLTGLISATSNSAEIGKVNKEHMLNILSGFGYNYMENTGYPMEAGKALPRSINQYIYIVMANSIAYSGTISLGRFAQELSNKVDRDELTEVSVVIESYVGDQSWYRLYSDGWLEQGGIYGNEYKAWTERMFNFIKPFNDTKYSAFCMNSHTDKTAACPVIKKKEKDYVVFMGTYNTGGFGNWYACGYAEKE